jgi:hypothetical protein
MPTFTAALERKIHGMAQFHVVQVSEDFGSGRWVIEEVVPGEKPIQISFFGSRAAAEAEVRRLSDITRAEGSLQPRASQP